MRISPSDSLDGALGGEAPFVVRGGGAQGVLGAVAQAGQRRLEVMGDVGPDTCFSPAISASMRSSIALRLSASRSNSSAGAGDGEPPREVAGHDAVRDRRHLVDALENAPRDEQPARHAEHDQQRQPPDGGADDDLAQLLALDHVAPDQQPVFAGQEDDMHQRPARRGGGIVGADIVDFPPAPACPGS